MSLAAALAADLLDALVHEDGAPRSVLLWLDPDGQFTRLRGAVATELDSMGAQLLSLDPGRSQFEIKLALLDVEAVGGKAVVHLPLRATADLDAMADGRPPALWGFVEYRFKGAVWGEGEGGRGADPASLDAWLKERGVRFSGGSARESVTTGGPDSLLARVAARMAQRDLAEFPEPVNAQTLAGILVGETRDRMIELLVDPHGAGAGWGDSTADVLGAARAAYGVALDGADPEGWAEQLAVHLALVDAWDALGREADFPFVARIPGQEGVRAAALSFLRSAILPRNDVAARLRAVVARCSGDLAGLVAWAGPRPGIPAAIPAIIDRRVADTLVALDSAGSAGAGIAELDARLPAGTDVGRIDPRLRILADVRELGHRAPGLRVVLEQATTPSAMAGLYARDGWQIDDAYVGIMAACREDAQMAPARKLAGRVYASFLDGVNQRFTDLVEAAGEWAPNGVSSVSSIAADLWSRQGKTRGRRGVIVVDALRLDIAQRLVEMLGQVELHTVAATLPTTTPFGMTALLPLGGERISVAVTAGSLNLSCGSSAGLEGRAGRKALIERVLGERGDTVAFVEFDAMLQGEPVPGAQFVVAFTYALDDQGHSAADTASLPDEATRLPGRLARVIKRLHAAGVSRVDVVTDHGFLWLDPADVDALGTPSIPPAQVVTKDPRYAILAPGAAATELIRLPMPFDPAIELGFPRGIRTLGKASWYAHGGISLQESIIPHIVSRAAAAQAPRVRATFVVPDTRLAGATVAVRVTPVVEAGPGGQLSLQPPRPTRIRLTVTATRDGAVTEVASPVRVEVRVDSPEQVTALYLTEGIRLPAGTALTLTAFDDETDETMFDQVLTLVTDWD